MEAQKQYDALAVQRIPVSAAPGKVVYHCLAFDHMIYAEYLATKPEGESAALEYLYDLCAKGIEGIKGELPANWKELIPKADKRDVIEKGLLAAEFVVQEADEADEEKEFSFADYAESAAEQITYPLRVRFNGEIIVCEHTLRRFTTEEREHLRKIAISKTIKEPEQVKKFCAFYDKLKISVTNYANEYVPPIHKVSVVVHHFSNESRVLAKN